MSPASPVSVLLRLEGLALGLVCIWLYRSIHAPWWYFAVLFLAPDISMLGYMAGPRVGAIAYNIVHTWVAPAVLFVIGWWGAGMLTLVQLLIGIVGFSPRLDKLVAQLAA